jgi:hypothetical protein
MKKRWLIFSVLVLAAALTLRSEQWWYPAPIEQNEAAYDELVRLTRACCSEGEHMDDLAYLERQDPERARLMDALDIDRVHSYPGVIFLERDLWGSLSTMHTYSLNGQPAKIIGCYTVEHIQGRWYRSHSLPCLL